MSTAARLGAFFVALVVVFAGGWAIGNAAGPVEEEPRVTHTEHAP